MQKYFSFLILTSLFLGTALQARTPEYAVDDIFTSRWSARAMSGEAVSQEELMSLFEAAKWAPSAYNGQPWRFVYATRNSAHWDSLFNLLVPFNQSWAEKAGALVLIVSRNTFEHNGETSRTHSFDAGAAWAYLALQGSMNGLVVHGMSGFDYEKAKEVLNISDDYTIEAMAAIGKPGTKKSLPDYMQDMEAPSDRKPLNETVFEGSLN